jgi:hypothetical protein
MTDLRCPECRQGKCVNCTRQAWDDTFDTLVPCDCRCQTGEPPTAENAVGSTCTLCGHRGPVEHPCPSAENGELDYNALAEEARHRFLTEPVVRPTVESDALCIECGDHRGWRVEPDWNTGDAVQVQCRACTEHECPIPPGRGDTDE